MTIDTAHLRELARKATPGPWRNRIGQTSRCPEVVQITITDHVLVCTVSSDSMNSLCNANFIAACTPEVITALCDKADAPRTLLTAPRIRRGLQGRRRSGDAHAD